MKLPKIITQEEFEKLLIAEEVKKYRLAYLLGFESGMRISEIVGLKGKGGVVLIKPLTKDKVEKASIRIEQGKGKKDRIVPRPKRLNDKALNLLPLKASRRAIQNRITNLGYKVLNRRITFHTLRHGFGSHLAGLNMPLHQIQMLMGHSRLDTTGIYLHANPKEAIDKAQELF